MTDPGPIDWSRELASCGDSGCILRDPSYRGIHTNGGCQHLKLDCAGQGVLLREIARCVVAQRAEIARRDAEAELAAGDARFEDRS